MFKYTQCTEEEFKFTYSADKFIEKKSVCLYRAILINASCKKVFRWITQLRYAPYSYDWIDNFGKQSPPYIITSAPPLRIDDTIMVFFKLIEFNENEYLTLNVQENIPLHIKILLKLFGTSFYATYQLFPLNNDSVRLVVKLVLNYKTSFNRWMIKLVDFGDYIMMRRQLLNFKELAENKDRKERRSEGRICMYSERSTMFPWGS